MNAVEKEPLDLFFERLSRSAAGAVALIGGVVILGWFFDWDRVRRLLPGFSEMRFNTALGFVLSGVSLWFSRPFTFRRELRVLSDACAGLAVLLGALTLWEYGTGSDLGIDQWAVLDRPDFPGEIPGRMAFNSALSFVPLGAAFFLLNRGKNPDNNVIQVLALVPLLAGGSSLVGFAYDMVDFLRWKHHFLPMAIHTSAAFVLLSLGVLAARPKFTFRQWMTSQSRGGQTVRVLLPGLIFFTLVLGRLIHWGFDADYYDQAFALALFSVANITGMGALILWSAGRFILSDERREKAEQEIRDSRELLGSIVENIPTALYLKDAKDLKFTLVNRAAREVLELDPAKALGKSVWDLYPSDQARFFTDTDRKLIAQGGMIDLPEVATYTPVKGDRRVHTRKVVIPGHDGAPKYLLGLSEDITELSKAAENQRILAGILEQTSDGVVAMDLEGNFLQWNKGAEKILGYRAEEVLGRNSSLLEPDNRAGETAAKRRSILERGETIHYDTVRKRKDGGTVYLSVSSSPLRDLSGKVIGYSAIYRDITNRVMEERRIQASEAKYREIYDNSLEGIFRTDLEGHSLQANRALARMLGYGSPEEAVRSIQDTKRDLWADLRDRDRFIDLLEKDGFVKGLEALWKRKDGNRIWAKLNAKMARDEQGVPLHIDGFITDITEQKRSDQAREKLEEQLRVAQKMEAIGSLAGGVAHDFNNILGVILTYTGILLEEMGEADPKRADLLEVRGAAERAAMLTRQLLAFGHKQVLQPVPLSLNDAARGLEKMLRRVLGEDIVFSLRLDPGLRTILADAGQMEQVIMNLVVNARDAMPNGGNLTIETMNQEVDRALAETLGIPDPGSYVVLKVSDTGCGMDEEVRARVFEPFFTTKPVGKGTGLGLSTVYGIVQQSGGAVLLDSAAGQGAAFRIYLPVEVSPKERVVPESLVIPAQARGKETLLLVEDETVLLKVTRRALETAGYRVLDASDGETALEISDQYPGTIDLLLTDVVMPRMDGVRVGKELAKKRPGIKILYMSGYPEQNGVRHEVLEEGSRFIPKPFTLLALTLKVREVLDMKKNPPLAKVPAPRKPSAGDL